jgi:hypothetical protein
MPPHRIAFGSCNDQDSKNAFWPIIESRKPTAFVWGGDAIYAGTEEDYRDIVTVVSMFVITTQLKLCRLQNRRSLVKISTFIGKCLWHASTARTTVQEAIVATRIPILAGKQRNSIWDV